MDSRRLHAILIRYQDSFLATFPALTAQDLYMIVTGSSEALLERLQVRYGYTRVEAKAAWNDFVLIHVDGHGGDGEDALHTARPMQADDDPALLARWALDYSLWRLLCLGWGRLSPHSARCLGFHRPRVHPPH